MISLIIVFSSSITDEGTVFFGFRKSAASPENSIQATTTIPVEAPVTHVQVSVPVVSHTPPKPDPVVIIGKLDASAGCDKPEYPQASLNAQEEGVVALSFLVDANNSVKESRVDKTSGYKRLDNAARDALSLCKFKAGTENGRPVASWVKIKYAWQLN